MTTTIDWLRRVPGLAPLVRRVRARLRALAGAADDFPGSAAYWQQRYAEGGDSGTGSYGRFASFKAEVLNGLVDEWRLQSVVEFGCGDGHQATLFRLPRYLGVDVSAEAVQRCRRRFAGREGWRFMTLDSYAGETAEAALSLDVLYHLVEDEAWDGYLRQLFAAATRCVVIYSSNHDAPAGLDGPHVRHRRFTDWVERHAPGWALDRHVPNAYPYRGDWRTGSFADFYVYRPRSTSPAA